MHNRINSAIRRDKRRKKHKLDYGLGLKSGGGKGAKRLHYNALHREQRLNLEI